VRAWAATALLVGLLAPAIPARDLPEDGTAAFRLQFLGTHCFTCHGPEKQRGDLRLDTAAYDLGTSTGRTRWQLVLDRIDDEEMPPREAPSHPERAERDRIVALIRADMDAAEAQAPVGHSSLRHLKRAELLNSVRDLFGIRGLRLPASYPEDVAALPSDAAPAGLALSAAHVHAAMELADDVAARMVFVPGPQVTSESDVAAWSQEAPMWAKGGDRTAMSFSGVNNAAWGGAVWDRAFIAPASGTYLVRVAASAEGEAGADGKPLRLGFYALLPGDYYMPESANRVDLPRVGALDIPASPGPQELSCNVELEQGESFHVYCENRLPATGPQGALNRLDLSLAFIAAIADPAPTVRIEHMSITGPVAPLTRQVEFLHGSALPSADEAWLRSVLLPLAERAYRRPPSAAEALDVLGPVMRHLEEVGSPELALRFGIRRILLSPAFQYLDPAEEGRGAYALASRLSYFLWSSLPDAELLGLAGSGRIAEPEVLREQVLRMLADPKGQRFVQDFTGLWLGNTELATLMVCDDRHVWNEPLRYGYIRSSEMFFDEMLQRNHSIRSFIDSDFTYANLPMRIVWGFPGKHLPMSRIESDQAQSHIPPEPERLDLRSLPRGVPPNVVNRGGVLGLPGVLTLTGDGVESSPIRRGVWVLENLYGTPPPPPPENVKALITDTSGARTVREILAAHQDSASCASCHSRIDPVGLALENYDAAGNWRALYNHGTPKPGVPFSPELVDPTGDLPDGAHLAGPQDLKQHLLAHPALFTRCLATKLLEYATGRRMTLGDARVVNRIVQDEPRDGYGFRDLLVALVQSEVFTTE
jgi:mono/diheme cytochrome c family protein